MFLISIIPAGAFSQYVKRLQVGNVLALEKLPFGYLTLARFQAPAPQHLWLLATGTGVAPFLSMLQDFEVWQRYQHIVLVYSVRHAAELAYQDEILAWVAQFNEAQIPFTYVPITTRDTATNFTQRIPALIASGVLAAHVGIPLDASTAHVMLCGNPQMVEDTRNTLKAQGLSMNRRGEGNIAVENYW